MARSLPLLRFTVLFACCLAAIAIVGPADISVAQSQAAPTRVRVFTPFGPGGLNAGIHVAARQRGECFTASLASQGRADAWRCTSGNTIFDPCYEGREGNATLVACPDSPWSGSVVLLTLTAALPENHAGPDEFLTSPPWALELAGGIRCQFLTGATALIAGMRINYGCTGRGGVVLGDADRTLPRWRVFFQAQNAFTVQLEEVVTAWY